MRSELEKIEGIELIKRIPQSCDRLNYSTFYITYKPSEHTRIWNLVLEIRNQINIEIENRLKDSRAKIIENFEMNCPESTKDYTTTVINFV